MPKEASGRQAPQHHPCKHCNQVLTSPAGLSRHVTDVHPEKKRVYAPRRGMTPEEKRARRNEQSLASKRRKRAKALQVWLIVLKGMRGGLLLSLILLYVWQAGERSSHDAARVPLPLLQTAETTRARGT